MAKRIKEFGGYSTRLQREAEEAQRKRFFRELSDQYEPRLREAPPSEWSKADSRRHYTITGSGNHVFKGVEFPNGVLPVNAREAEPSLLQRIQVEGRLALRSFRRFLLTRN